MTTQPPPLAVRRGPGRPSKGSRARFPLRLPIDLMRELRAVAAEAGRSVNDEIERRCRTAPKEAAPALDTASAVEQIAAERAELAAAVRAAYISTMPTLRREHVERAAGCWESMERALQQLGARVDDDTLTQIVTRALPWDTAEDRIRSVVHSIEHAYDDPDGD